ncbi:hypothetical protein [Microlunatus speluncae]|uniref:hypothetical protein n=1 Tax=Microlunatus speluncae TaxID=2594267 RepID=UPI0012660F94|nr:hypothetical protein [Microlunatus speluncae]
MISSTTDPSRRTGAAGSRIRRLIAAGAAVLAVFGTTLVGAGPASAAAPRCSWGLTGDDGDAGGVSGWVKIGSSLKVQFRAYGERIIANRNLRGGEGVLLFVDGKQPSFMGSGDYANLTFPEGRDATLSITNGDVNCAVDGLVT